MKTKITEINYTERLKKFLDERQNTLNICACCIMSNDENHIQIALRDDLINGAEMVEVFQQLIDDFISPNFKLSSLERTTTNEWNDYFNTQIKTTEDIAWLTFVDYMNEHNKPNGA